MVHHSTHLKLPAAAPYDGDHDLASFVGNYVRPLAPELSLFWFSKYGAAGAREIKFRFSVHDYEKVRLEVERIEVAFPHGADGCGGYNFESDLGNDRFLAPARRATDQGSRALLAYEFLTAGARLYIDCLEQQGSGWRPEEEKTSGYNRETSLEQFHHLFCNMTTVPTWAAVLQLPSWNPNALGPLKVVSDLQARALTKPPSPIVQVSLSKIEH